MVWSSDLSISSNCMVSWLPSMSSSVSVWETGAKKAWLISEVVIARWIHLRCHRLISRWVDPRLDIEKKMYMKTPYISEVLSFEIIQMILTIMLLLYSVSLTLGSDLPRLLAKRTSETCAPCEIAHQKQAFSFAPANKRMTSRPIWIETIDTVCACDPTRSFPNIADNIPQISPHGGKKQNSCRPQSPL